MCCLLEISTLARAGFARVLITGTEFEVCDTEFVDVKEVTEGEFTIRRGLTDTDVRTDRGDTSSENTSEVRSAVVASSSSGGTAR